jgi:hypothetical protein
MLLKRWWYRHVLRRCEIHRTPLTLALTVAPSIVYFCEECQEDTSDEMRQWACLPDHLDYCAMCDGLSPVDLMASCGMCSGRVHRWHASCPVCRRDRDDLEFRG